MAHYSIEIVHDDDGTCAYVYRSGKRIALGVALHETARTSRDDTARQAIANARRELSAKRAARVAS